MACVRPCLWEIIWIVFGLYLDCRKEIIINRNYGKTAYFYLSCSIGFYQQIAGNLATNNYRSNPPTIRRDIPGAVFRAVHLQALVSIIVQIFGILNNKGISILRKRDRITGISTIKCRRANDMISLG